MPNFNELKTALETSQRCRRNWDLSKAIPKEHLDMFTHSVINSPAKQNEEYYSVTFVTDRNIIEKIYSHTNFNSEIDIDDLSKNPQVLANLLVVFCKRDPKTTRADISQYESKAIIDENRYMSIGIASGQLALTATLLGYSTGFCKCFDIQSVGSILNDTPILLLGIGYPDNSRDRTEHHLSKLKFATYNKPISIKNIDQQGISTQEISGDFVVKESTIEIKFTAPADVVLSSRLKEQLKQSGVDNNDIKELLLDIQDTSNQLGIDTGYTYLDVENNSLRYIWTSDDLDKLQSLKEFILSRPIVSSFIRKVKMQGWTVD